MRIRIKERRPETPGVMSFIFDLGGQPFDYRPGQFAYFELDELLLPDEKGKRRHFTLSSSPTEKGVLMITTRMRGSGFKETLARVPLGTELTVEPADGEFVMPAGERRRHIFIAGGIGITPYRSILKSVIDGRTPIRALLLDFNRSSSDLIFWPELQDFAIRIPTLEIVPVLAEPGPGWGGETGIFRMDLLQKYVPRPEHALFWISGPPAMVQEIEEMMEKSGIDPESMRHDQFLGY